MEREIASACDMNYLKANSITFTSNLLPTLQYKCTNSN